MFILELKSKRLNNHSCKHKLKTKEPNEKVINKITNKTKQNNPREYKETDNIRANLTKVTTDNENTRQRRDQ